MKHYLSGSHIFLSARTNSINKFYVFFQMCLCGVSKYFQLFLLQLIYSRIIYSTKISLVFLYIYASQRGESDIFTDFSVHSNSADTQNVFCLGLFGRDIFHKMSQIKIGQILSILNCQYLYDEKKRYSYKEKRKEIIQQNF